MNKLLGMRTAGIMVSALGGLVLAGCGATVSEENDTTPTTPTVTAKLADTGMGSAYCYKAGSDELVSCTGAEAQALSTTQDGMVGLDVTAPDSADGALGFSYTKMDAAGNAMAQTAIGWKCVKDNITGLVWEGKTDDGGLHDKDNTYSNAGTNASGDVSKFVADVNAAGWCGRTDWRLPTAWELQGLVHYGTPVGGWGNPRIDTAWFTNTSVNSVAYWASDAVAWDSTLSWGVEFVQGDVYWMSRNSAYHVRLVSGSQATSTGRFTVSTDGSEVTDAQTGLTWRRCMEGSTWNGNDACVDGGSAGLTFTHENALLRAKTVASQTGKAWRMPNVRELSSLIDRSRSAAPYIDPDAFPQAHIGWYWTSTPKLYVDTTTTSGVAATAGTVRSLSFGSGYVLSDPRSAHGQLRLVRDAQ